jgi:hypothetical protein
MAGREHHASLRQLRAVQADRRKFGPGDPDDPAGEEHPEPPEQTDPPTVTDPAHNEATVPQVDGAVEEAKGPIDVTQAPAGEIPGSRSQIPNPSSETAGAPRVPVSFEEIETIEAAYRDQIDQVVRRVEQEFGLGGEGPASQERPEDPKTDRPPLGFHS